MSTFSLLGCAVRIEADGAFVSAVLETLAQISAVPQHVQPLHTWHARPARGGLHLTDESGSLGVWPEETAAKVLGSAVELWAAARAPEHVVIHAGVVAVAGRAIVLPGRSLAGKSTLTAALLRAGATYYSDEFALLGSDGRVHAYPRPLSLRPGWSEAPPGGGLVAAAALGAPVGSEPVPVGVIARLDYREGSQLDVAEVSAGLATLMLIDNAVAARTRSEEVLRTTALVAERATSLDGSRGEAEVAAADLIAVLARI